MTRNKAKWTASAVLAGGLLITGIAVGAPATPVSHPKTKAAASVTGEYANLDACPLLSVGYQGGCVQQLQVELNAALGTTLTPDGDFGSATQQAVEAFQQDHQISPVDGQVGPLTKAALDSATEGSGLAPASAPTPAASAPPSAQPSSPAAAAASGGAADVLAPGLDVVTSPPAGTSGGTVHHHGDKAFGFKLCSAPLPGTSNGQVCEQYGGDLVIADYAAPTGHNEFITRMGAEFISAESVHNPWIDFDYFSTGGQLIYHWQGPPHATSHEYDRRVYTPIAGNYYDFTAAGNLCATMYSNPGQSPVEVARACLSVGPQS